METVAALVRTAIEQKNQLELDNRAFGELVRRFQDMVFGYACSLVGDPVLAQDIVQDSFLTAWRRLDQIRDHDAFPGWLRRIARSASMDELRRHRTVPLGEEAEGQLPARDSGPVETLLHEESARETRNAISRLPESQRASVYLHYVDGYTLAEVASFLEIDVAAAKKRLQRGRERMRKDLEARIRKTVQELRPGRDSRLVDSINYYANFEIAAQLGQVSLLEAMLVDGYDPNEPDATGRTLLHWAVEHHHHEAVALLLRNGADQHLRDHEGRSARHIAQALPDARPILELLDGYR
jgi:RNA polymerase sigma-70 factor (ECF subfamily)